MTFLPKRDLLTLEELDRLCSAFVARGVRKLRITGGEPLVRKNIMWLMRALSRHLETGALEELTLTTNASQLAKYAADLKACGVRRINVSLDTLDAQKVQGHHALGRAFDRSWTASRRLSGPASASRSMRSRLKGVNEDEFDDLDPLRARPRLRPDADRDHAARARSTATAPISTCRSRSCAPGSWTAGRWTTSPIARAGRRATCASRKPAGGSASSRRSRTTSAKAATACALTCTGTLYMCLGQEDAADLRAPLRASADDGLLHEAIDAAIARKPKGHDFVIDRRSQRPALTRHMSVTGG